MARTIEISDSTYVKLKALMRTSDTTETVISKLLDEAQRTVSSSVKTIRQAVEADVSMIRGKRKSDLEFINQPAPDLTHAKLLLAYVNGREVRPIKWNQLLITTISGVVKKDSKTAMSGMSGIILSQKNDSGYKYYADLGLSVQGQDANDAWRLTTEIAHKYGWVVEILCEWRPKDGAAYPGQSAIIVRQ
jgi:predicted CopG family antitoxin